MDRKEIAVIAGAGPAGLTAAYELLTRTNIQPIIFEKTQDIGGISKTVNYKGNRIDIGGHRFFSKSDRVMEWWLKMLPLDVDHSEPLLISYQGKTTQVPECAIGTGFSEDKVMLVRERVSRIYFIRKFFQYPLSININTLSQLGIVRTLRILFSYINIRIRALKNEKNLEEFFINRFGKELYYTFFKAYTEKVWGKSCVEIPATWGKQRIKSLSISRAIRHAITRRLIFKTKDDTRIKQKNTETSLIEKFLYPKFGPGQLWEEVATKIIELGGKIIFESEIIEVYRQKEKITSISTRNKEGKVSQQSCDYFFSTMPVKQLITNLIPRPTNEILQIAMGLEYRDFLTVGLLLSNFGKKTKRNHEIKDNWIYIQDDTVRVGRIQVFNNWSPAMVKNKSHTWIGMEYFCNQTDDLWSLSKEALANLAIKELQQLELAEEKDLLDSTVIHMEKAYPAYFGTYDHFPKIIEYTNEIENLFLIGRNGMHRYNNSDHSMLTAMIAVDNIISGKKNKESLWDVNTEETYHEQK